MIPKLFQLLRTGGKGHAVKIFPKILPLISEIPQDKMGEKSAFYSQLFKNMAIGYVYLHF